ncbi:MAG: LamG domain-containing protein [Bacteroidota bacterium]|nr:LamG domain-containing protein [Bacteroidota bacterium]
MRFRLLFLICFIGFTLLSCKKQESSSNTQTDLIEKQLRVGLIAYYPFNGNAYDESGNGYNLTVNDAVLSSNRFGEPSKAFIFNGKNATMVIPKLLKADSLRQTTISVWVKPQYLRYECILSFLPRNKICSYFLAFDNNSSTYRTRHSFVDKNTAYDCSATLISDNISSPLNTWVHLVLVQTYSYNNLYPHNSYLQYFNGNKLQGSSSSSSPIATSFSSGGTIGCNNNSGNTNFNFDFFIGSIDDIRVYDRALSDEEIKQLFNLHE